jgi:hypothetical protein
MKKPNPYIEWAKNNIQVKLEEKDGGDYYSDWKEITFTVYAIDPQTKEPVHIAQEDTTISIPRRRVWEWND